MSEEVFNIGKLEFNREKESVIILLIDHNGEQGSAIVNKLSKHFEIGVCNNLGTGFLKALEGDYSLLIVNIEVADIECVKWCIEFKNTSVLKYLPLIVLVDRNDKEKLDESFKMGVYDCIMIPIDFNELFGRVRLQIRNFKYQEKLRIEYIKTYITDMLTGLYNRKYLETYFLEVIKEVESKQGSYVLCMVDIDNFKKVNDNYGHARGDRVLQKVSKIILENTGNRDFIGRLGGEEFVIIFHKLTVKKVKRIMDRIRREVGENSLKDISGGNKISCTVSGGIDEIRYNDTLEGVLGRADRKLYRAKFLGKNRVVS